jgi:hypothetical protein
VLSSGQLFQFLQQLLVVRDSLLLKANKAVAVNEIGDPPAAEQAANFTFLICDQGIGDAVELAELPVGVEAVTTDAQNLGIELFKAGNVPLKSLQLARSDRGEVGVIESQHQVFFTQQISQMNGPMSRFAGKQRD